MVSLRCARPNQKELLRNLMQLYLYDFSEIEKSRMNAKGLFEYKYLKYYWTEPKKRFPFLIYVDGKVAGFVLVKTHEMVTCRGEGYEIAEFFVARPFRRHGVGMKAAPQAFDRFRGLWEVSQTEHNRVARRFWRGVIRRYTKGRFRETFVRADGQVRPVQAFRN
ncbi:MAG: GNAT family N-acetyltransferase [Candidatus Coatesbacteria bacterium]